MTTIDETAIGQVTRLIKEGKDLRPEDAPALESLFEALSDWKNKQSSRETSKLEELESQAAIEKVKNDLLFNKSLDGFFVMDLKDGCPFRILEVNHAACELLGYSREELESIDLKKVFPSQFCKLEEERVPKAEGMSYPFRRLRLKHKNKTLVPVDLGPHWAKIGSRSLLFAIVRDMTDNEQAYETLRNSEKQLLTLFHAIPDLILNIDHTGKIISRKPGTFASADGTRDAVFRHEMFERAQSIYEFIPPEMLDPARAAVYEVLRDQSSTVVEFQSRGISKSGRIRDFEARVCPVDREEIVIIVREITDRKRRDAALARSESRLRLLYNNNPFLIFNLGPDQSIRSINTSALEALDYNEEELLQTSRLFLIHEGDREYVEARFNDYLTGGDETDSWEYRMLKRDGGFFWVEERVKVTKDLKGRRTIVASCRDITRRREAEQAILDSLKEKEVLLREVHHRVKNNLQIINSMLSLQMGQFQDHQLHDILKSSQNRILSMSLIHENLYRSEGLDNIDTKEYFKELCTHLFSAYDIQPGKIQVEYLIEEVPLGLERAIPLGLIVNELVTNVIKYAFKGMEQGKVSIKLHAKGEHIHFAFADNGIGMEENFDFERASSMGLRMIRILSKQLRGQVQFGTKGGFSYRLTLPLASPDDT